MNNIVVDGITWRPSHRHPMLFAFGTRRMKHWGQPAIWRNGWLYVKV